MRASVLVAAVVLVCCPLSWCEGQDARSELNAGVAAYKGARFEEAIRHFEAVVRLDPNSMVGHLYLGTTLAQEYVPGMEDPANTEIGERAIGEFRRVLDLKPDELNAMKAIAALSFQMKRFEEAKEFHEKVVAADPNDAEAYYAIGVIDWTQTYVPRMETRARLGLKPVESLIFMSECPEVRASNWDKVADGIHRMARAMELRPDYDDAMAYLNLLYRERADLQCGDAPARDSDLATADHWVAMTMKIKKQKAEQQKPN